MSLEQLTLLSTTLVVASGLSLLAGWYLIRGPRRVEAHRNAMLLATALAAAFLAAYVSRWVLHGSKPFPGTGAWRALYLGILVPHVLLAIAVGPLALRLIWLALARGDWPAHRRLGRITAPIWLVVAASGWAVYWMLYRMEF